MKYLVLLGRVFFSLIFIKALPFHFSSDAIAYAMGQGVPLANIAVPLSGLMAFAGGLSIALGYKAKWGAWLIVLFLVPITIMMHNFWTLSDAMAYSIQQTMFLKNISMMGCALMITQMGAGPVSFDAKK